MIFSPPFPAFHFTPVFVRYDWGGGPPKKKHAKKTGAKKDVKEMFGRDYM